MEKHDVENRLGDVQGILIPGGFGDRGTEGKVRAVRYARENKVPFFGICLGMQIAVAEFGRNVCSLKGANSVEFDPDTKHPVIHLMDEQKGLDRMGGTMRLGAYPCVLANDSLSARMYRKKRISERHRHRYEFNNRYRELMQDKGLRISGLSPDGNLVEIIELKDHPWFVGCQFHPEFKSRPTDCHPLFRGVHPRRLAAEFVGQGSPAHAHRGGRDETMTASEVPIGGIQVGGGRPLALIAGSCVIESRESALRHAAYLHELTRRLDIPSSTSRPTTRPTAPLWSRFAARGSTKGCAFSRKSSGRSGSRCSPTCTNRTRSRRPAKSWTWHRFRLFFAVRPTS